MFHHFVNGPGLRLRRKIRLGVNFWGDNFFESVESSTSLFKLQPTIGKRLGVLAYLRGMACRVIDSVEICGRIDLLVTNFLVFLSACPPHGGRSFVSSHLFTLSKKFKLFNLRCRNWILLQVILGFGDVVPGKFPLPPKPGAFALCRQIRKSLRVQAIKVFSNVLPSWWACSPSDLCPER